MENLKNLTVQQLLNIAKGRVNNYHSGKQFTVQDLFADPQGSAKEWKTIAHSVRGNLGMRFNKWATSDNSSHLRADGKTEQGQQLYTKI